MVSTRTKSYTHDAVPRRSGGVESTVESLDDRRLKWAWLLREQHYQAVISDVLKEELPKHENGTTLNVTDRVSYLRECTHILASAPSVFASAVEGDLVRRMLSEPGLREEHAAIMEQARHQPSIYIHLLADRDGTPPTPNQYLTIRDFVNDYLSRGKDSEHAWQIDNIFRPSVTKQKSAMGHRKYLHASRHSANRVETLRRFCQGAQQRWLETPESSRDTPFRYPPGECGYSICSSTRLAQHRAHQSSNFVMNLVEDICTYLHKTGDFKEHFIMHQYIIYLIWKAEQVSIAEIFCSGLLQVWVENGGGFNAYPAGRSNASAKKVSDAGWAMYKGNAMLNSPFFNNMTTQQHRDEEWRQALELATYKAVDLEMRGGFADEEEECIAGLSQLSIQPRAIERRV